MTTDGGVLPIWSRDGDEIGFLDNQAIVMQSVAVRTEPTLTRDNPVSLFPVSASGLRVGRSGQPAFDVRADGQLLFNAREGLLGAEDETDDFRRINVVGNWFQELLERVPVE